MASIYSDGRTIQLGSSGIANPLPLLYGGQIPIPYYDAATLTGVAATNTVTFREGIPKGARIIKSLSKVWGTDQGTGGTMKLGDAAEDDRFCSAVDTDTADWKASLDEADATTELYEVTVNEYKPVMTRNTADVTGSPTVGLLIWYLPPMV